MVLLCRRNFLVLVLKNDPEVVEEEREEEGQLVEVVAEVADPPEVLAGEFVPYADLLRLMGQLGLPGPGVAMLGLAELWLTVK